MPNVNLLLGINGSGKTTALRALALAAIAPILPQSGFLPYRYIRQTTESSSASGEIKAEVLLHPQDVSSSGLKPANATIFGKNVKINQLGEIKLGITKSHDQEFLDVHLTHFGADTKIITNSMYDDDSPAYLVVGYGTTRRVEDNKTLDLTSRRKLRRLRYERVASLFENYFSLIPLTAWLPQYKTDRPDHYEQVVNLINRLLPENARFLAELEQGDYLFEVQGTPAPFSVLSDGYQAYIGWIADLLHHICIGVRSGGKLEETHGIVLVDEIDSHLHPEWQRIVIPTIAEALPNLQFVFTTHSPIVAGSVENENIFVMETTADGSSVVRQYDEDIYGLNVEQILLGPYFNLATTRAANFAGELKALSLKAGRGDLDAALEFMQRLASPKATVNGKPSVKAASTLKNGKKKTSSKKKALKSKS